MSALLSCSRPRWRPRCYRRCRNVDLDAAWRLPARGSRAVLPHRVNGPGAVTGHAYRTGMMSLPASQQRKLGGIEKTLLADDLRLGSLFAIFTRLTGHEAMPGTERVEAGSWWRLRPAVLGTIALIAVVGLLLLSLLVPGRSMCTAAATSASMHIALLRAGRQAACPAQPTSSKASTPAGSPRPGQ